VLKLEKLRYFREVEILNPLNEFREETQLIEHRKDPLTGDTTIIQRSGYFKDLFKSNPEIISKLAEKSREKCPFCSPKVEISTPKYPGWLLPEGKMKLGECTAVPNLFAHTDFNVIVVLGRKHHLPLNEFTSTLLSNGLRVGVKILSEVGVKKLGVKYGSIIMNYLPPAGSSIFHPHLQVLGSANEDFNFQRKLVKMSEAYYRENGENYWDKLIEREKESNRYIMQTGRSCWFTSFAPLRSYEVQAVVKGKSNLLELDEEDFLSLAEGITKILGYYYKENISCFNFAVYSGPLTSTDTHYFYLNLRIGARFGLNETYVNDVWGLPGMLFEGFSLTLPEECAAEIRRTIQL
jgi:galactose-1-phosphate uridylyltransferase